jgi:pimeloyl-ACP methyl ester carboxylesterase
MRNTNLALALLAGAVLAACGGSSSNPGPTVDHTLTRGSLVANPPNLVPIPQADGTALKSLDPAVFGKMLEAAQPGLTQVTGAPKCAITVYYMQYGTVGGKGESTDAGGAIMVPSGTGCTGPRPVLLYTHGTTVDRNYNMANIRDNAEASLVAASFAAQGFIVVAPNFAGYDGSSLKYHPYLNAEQQANDSIDSLRAARKAFAGIGAEDSGKLVITGYSQGGYVAMATERAMQLNYASEFKVTALAGLSGPYAMSLFTDVILAGSPDLGSTVFFPLLMNSWQNSYGNIYSSVNDVYESQYASGIDTLLPGTASIDQLFSTGKLPQAALFNTASLPGPASPAFAAFFGDHNLVKTSFRNLQLADAQAHPCNLNPADPLNCAPGTGLRTAARTNDLRTYVPNVPTLLCGGNSDPTVYFVNTQATAGYFQAKGMPAPLLTVVDIDSAPTSASDPFAAAKVGFGQAKGAVIAGAVAAHADPVLAVTLKYHGDLLPPFCEAAARGFFQNVLAH